MQNREISVQIGKRIRGYRKKRQMTIEQLAKAIAKSKATVSKYEKGEIAMDVETLYEVADALHVHVEQILCVREERAALEANGNAPAFLAAYPSSTRISLMGVATSLSAVYLMCFLSPSRVNTRS